MELDSSARLEWAVKDSSGEIEPEIEPELESKRARARHDLLCGS
jgi:hypothetical protein